MDKIIWTSQPSHGDAGLLYPGRVLVVGADVPLAVAEKWVTQGVADVYVEPQAAIVQFDGSPLPDFDPTNHTFVVRESVIKPKGKRK